MATFTKTVRSDVDIEADPRQAAAARRQYEVELASRQKALAAYESETLPGKLREWLGRRQQTVPSVWTIVEPASVRSAGGATFNRLPDGSLLAGGRNARLDTYTLVLRTQARDVRAVRLEALAHPGLVKGGPGRATNGNFALSDVKITAAPLAGGKPEPVKITRARATFEQKGLPVAATIDGDARSGWAIDPQFGKDHAAVFDLAEPVGFEGGTQWTVTLRFGTNTGHNIARPRLSLSTEVTPPAVAGDGMPEEVRQILAALAGEPAPKEQATLLRWYRGQDVGWRKQQETLERLRQNGPAVERFKAMICGEGLKPVRLHSQGADYLQHTHFLERGDPNQKKGLASPGFLQVLMRNPEGEKRWQVTPPEGARTPYLRRSLAGWMTDVEYGAGHLLARVIVNRLWQHHFGRGIVATPSDFGLQGERPSHPELLDWLASELIAGGWQLKPIHRLIVTSAAYRQATAFDKDKAAIDPGNRLVWRRVPRRLEAEVIRDSLLAVSGQLDRWMFGPGTLEPTMKRRSVYFFVKRSRLVPMMVLFDAPDGTVGIEQRTTTTIAPQALLLMNNPVVRNAAHAFAGRLAALPQPADRVRAGYAQAVGRPPSAAELADAVAFLQEQAGAYREPGTGSVSDRVKADADQLALADFCQVLLGLNEFIYID